MPGGKKGHTYLTKPGAKKASWKQLLNEELKRWFLLNVYVNVSDLFFDFAVHKLCRTLENSILHFAVGISRFCFLYYT